MFSNLVVAINHPYVPHRHPRCTSVVSCTTRRTMASELLKEMRSCSEAARAEIKQELSIKPCWVNIIEWHKKRRCVSNRLLVQLQMDKSCWFTGSHQLLLLVSASTYLRGCSFIEGPCMCVPGWTCFMFLWSIKVYKVLIINTSVYSHNVGTQSLLC